MPPDAVDELVNAVGSPPEHTGWLPAIPPAVNAAATVIVDEAVLLQPFTSVPVTV